MSMQIWEHGLKFTANSGQWNLVRIPCPSRGMLRKFILTQVTGTTNGFEFDLFNRRDASILISAESDLGHDTNLHLNAINHRVLPHINQTGLANEQFGLAAPYENQDEQDQRRLPSHQLWLDIKPNGSGPVDFHLSIAVEPFN